MSEAMRKDVTNILVVGIGGQGVMTATEILAEAALGLGYDVKKTEVAGMAQRGGVVTSHLRFGPKVLSPQITAGEADILLADIRQRRSRSGLSLTRCDILVAITKT